MNAMILHSVVRKRYFISSKDITYRLRPAAIREGKLNYKFNNFARSRGPCKFEGIYGHIEAPGLRSFKAYEISLFVYHCTAGTYTSVVIKLMQSLMLSIWYTEYAGIRLSAIDADGPKL